MAKVKYIQGQLTEQEWLVFRQLALAHRINVKDLLRMLVRDFVATGRLPGKANEEIRHQN
jgi:hypothetical protein